MKKTNSCIVLCPLVLLAWTILSDAGDPCEGNECSTGLDEGVEELRIDESLNEYDQEDERLIEILKNEYLVSPDSKKSIFLSQKPSSKSLGGQFGQPYEIDDMYKGMREGFFIEAGAYDGEGLSNTLFLELKRNWTGLLVEPNPDIYPVLAKRNRNANLLPHCLSTQPRPEIVQFDVSALIGGIIQQGRVKPGDIDRSPDYVNRPYRRHTVRMQCFPIYSILMALGNPTVHYFSLDIEGAEFPVLKTIPWDKVDIRVLDIEFNHLGDVFDGSHDDVMNYMKENGYDYHGLVGIDAIFVKRGTKLAKKLKKQRNKKAKEDAIKEKMANKKDEL